MPTEPKPIDVTRELAEQLLDSQREHTADLLTRIHDTDDGYDYRTSALRLCYDLEVAVYDDDMAQISTMLNFPEHLIVNYACDGIAPLFYELNCLGVTPVD